jgi:hypothetical protein
VIVQAHRNCRHIGFGPIELQIQVVGVIKHLRQCLDASHVDDGALDLKADP